MAVASDLAKLLRQAFFSLKHTSRQKESNLQKRADIPNPFLPVQLRGELSGTYSHIHTELRPLATKYFRCFLGIIVSNY